MIDFQKSNDQPNIQGHPQPGADMVTVDTVKAADRCDLSVNPVFHSVTSVLDDPVLPRSSLRHFFDRLVIERDDMGDGAFGERNVVIEFAQ